jgi:hypothetical protein
MLLLTRFLSGQCETDLFLDRCASNLGTYNFIKSFVVKASPRKKVNTEFMYVFSKGSKYIIIACPDDNEAGEMVINLYDRDHNLMASTYDSRSGKNYPDLEYPCSATGVYYVSTDFKNRRNGCGLCILGFTKD